MNARSSRHASGAQLAGGRPGSGAGPGVQVRRFRRERWLEAAILCARQEWRALGRHWGRVALGCGVLAGAVSSGLTVSAIRGAAARSPLPWREPSRIVHLEASRLPDHPRSLAGIASLPTVREQAAIRERVAALESLAGWSPTWGFLGDERAQPVRLGRLRPGLLEILGVPPALGRPFSAADHAEAGVGGPRAVLLGHRMWRRLGAAPGIEGREILLNGSPVRVAGVMPPGFFFPEPGFEAWVPAPEFRLQLRNRGSAHSVLARLAPGATPEAAAAEVTAVLRNAGEFQSRETARVTRATAKVTASLGPVLTLLGAGALLLVLCGAVAVGALRLSQEALLRRDDRIRRALGAGRLDAVARGAVRVAVSTLLVGVLGSLLGALILALCRRLGGSLPFADSWRLSGGAVAVGLVLALAAVALAEAPAALGVLRSRRAPFSSTVASGGTSVAALGFLALGIAASTTMLIAAATVSGSAFALLAGRGGFPAAGLAQLTVDFGATDRPLRHEEKTAALDRIVSRLGAGDAVVEAAYADAFPDGIPRFYHRTDGTRSANRDSAQALIRVSPGFLGALRVPVLEGRGLLPEDDPPGAPVAVVSRSLARRIAGEPTDLSARGSGPSAVGRTVGEEEREARVVGVVADIRRFPENTSLPAAYLPFAAPPPAALPIPRAEIAVRLAREPTRDDLSNLARTAAEAGSVVRVLRAESVRDRRARFLGGGVLAAVLIAAYAGAALALAIASGIGQVRRSFLARQHSSAVRQSLGAPPDLLLWEMARQTALAAGAGIAVGALAAWLLLRGAAASVPWIEAADPLLYAGPAALLALILTVAVGLTAFRAVRRPLWRSLRSP